MINQSVLTILTIVHFIRKRLLRSTERILFTSFFIPAGIDRGMDAGSFQALAAILDYLTHFGSISCWHQSDVIQQELRLSQDAYIYCEFQKYEAMTMSVIGGQPKKKTHTHTQIPVTRQQNTSYAFF